MSSGALLAVQCSSPQVFCEIWCPNWYLAQTNGKFQQAVYSLQDKVHCF